jgi:protein-L-isoaspartate(D-aspartate) O-methyltransferase
MEAVPRHLFVPSELRPQAYEDQPVDIGWGYTVYQPYMVARMTELLGLKGGEKVLEIGTGSGYHSAVLARIAGQVRSMEINSDLARDARRTLRSLGFTNVDVRVGDGYQGWPEEAPFDAIILTAAPPHIPQPLIEQLKLGGRMVIPLGGELQNLLLVTKTKNGIERQTVAPVRVPLMEGEARNRRR